MDNKNLENDSESFEIEVCGVKAVIREIKNDSYQNNDDDKETLG